MEGLAPFLMLLLLIQRSQATATLSVDGYTHRFGDCPADNIKKMDGANKDQCGQECTKFANCKSFIWVNKGSTSYCFLKIDDCRVLRSQTEMNFHFFNKQGNQAHKEYILDGTDANIQLKGTAKFVDSDIFGKALSFSNTAIAQVPRMEIGKTSFSIAAYVKFRSFGSYQTIFSDFTRYWQFLFRVDNNKVRLILRRNINSGGSDPNQDLVAVGGGDISKGPRNNTWQLLACTWNRETRIAKVFLNGIEVDAKSTTYTDLDLQVNGHPLYEIGGNPAYGWSLQGEMARLKIFFYAINQAEVDALYDKLGDLTLTSILVGQQEVSDTPDATLQLDSVIRCAMLCLRATRNMSSISTCREFVYTANLGVCKIYGKKTSNTPSGSGGNTVQHFRRDENT